MTPMALDIKILKKGDPPLHEWPDAQEVEIEEVVIIEQGMRSGEPSVAIAFRLPDGHICIAQTSGALLDALAASVRGVAARPR